MHGMYSTQRVRVNTSAMFCAVRWFMDEVHDELRVHACRATYDTTAGYLK